MKNINIILLAFLVFAGIPGSLAFGQEQSSARNWTDQQRLLAKRLDHPLNLKPPADCAQRCERPASVDEKIYCCVSCLGVLYICGVTGSCYCEIPFD
jgi:hypothetical protein